MQVTLGEARVDCAGDANIATTRKAKSTLPDIADKYDAIASGAHEPPDETDDS